MLEDIVIPESCPILRIPIIYHSGSSGGKINSPALDRIDNSKGYIKGNVLVISHLANMMKSCANEEQLILFAQWVFDNYKKWFYMKLEKEDYYIVDGKYVFTETYHLKRGSCCGNGCKHCPYKYEAVPEPKRSQLLENIVNQEK